MSYRVKVRERKKNKGAMLSLYLEFMPPYVAPNGECVRYENLNLELYVNPANEIQEKHNRMIHEIAETIRCERYITLVQKIISLYRKTNSRVILLSIFITTVSIAESNLNAV